jgi:hypothetical protein
MQTTHNKIVMAANSWLISFIFIGTGIHILIN